MSYQGKLRRKLMEIKSLMSLTFKDIETETGIHRSLLQQFGSMRTLLSKNNEAKLSTWLEKNGGGYDLAERDSEMVQ